MLIALSLSLGRRSEYPGRIPKQAQDFELDLFGPHISKQANAAPDVMDEQRSLRFRLSRLSAAERPQLSLWLAEHS
jgi:hypothetical protein